MHRPLLHVITGPPTTLTLGPQYVQETALPQAIPTSTPNPRAPLSTLEVIRLRTRPLHAQLEAAIDLQAALTSLTTYRRLLLRYLAFYEPFELLLQARLLATQTPAIRALIAHPQRSRVQLLLADLRALGMPHPIAPPLPLPPFDTLDQLLGALYVIEGSSLGGQIIYRQIQHHLHLDHTTGAAFFYGDGGLTGDAWKQFLTILQQHVTQPDEAALAAETTFHLFEQALVETIRGATSA